MAEFFITYKYRRHGVGKYAAKYIFDKIKGKWQLKIHPKNIISEKFWIKIIDEYTKGDYKIINNASEAICEGGTMGHVIIFKT
jgi:predicted acetyltransferase